MIMKINAAAYMHTNIVYINMVTLKYRAHQLCDRFQYRRDVRSIVIQQPVVRNVDVLILFKNS